MADLKSTFSKGLTVLNVKTANFLEVNKIKTYIATLNTEIAALKAEIGEIVYQDWTKEHVTLAHIEKQLNDIAEKEATIKKQQTELDELELKEKQILGNQNPVQTSGGAVSGAAAPGTAAPGAAGFYPTPSDGSIICPNCGQKYEHAINFCRKCGTKLN